MSPRTPLRPSPRSLLAVAALLTASAVAGCGNTDPGGMPGMDHGASSAPSSPAGSVTPASGAHNAADVRFAQLMIPHHQQAIEMSDLILAKEGIDQRVVDLAGQIKAAQAPEIDRMAGWLSGWGQGTMPSADHMGHGGGMASQAELDQLEKATGDKAATLFLTAMIEHHKGAIAMAQEEIADGENPEAKGLAATIAQSQQAEIDTMTTLLNQL